ncbi:hypothetical protein Tco_1555525 [Tanacetum coccineum]
MATIRNEEVLKATTSKHVGTTTSDADKISSADYRSSSSSSEELHLKKNDKMRVRVICRGKLQVFAFDGPSVDDGPSNTDGPSEASGSAKFNKETKDSGNLKSNNGSKYFNGCPWVLQCSKLNNEETWQGAIPAIAEMCPCAEHRYYLKHINDKVKVTWREHNKEAYDWKLVDGRDKPIITCLEFIREYLMKRIVNVRLVIRKCNGPLTPNAERLIGMGRVMCILTSPKYTPQPGRLRKKRKKSASKLSDVMAKGGKLTREGKSVTCTKYGQVGHN